MTTGDSRKLIHNRWLRRGGVERAQILANASAPEGLDAARVRFVEADTHHGSGDEGHIISVIAGEVRLEVGWQRLRLGAGVHVYLPPGPFWQIIGTPGAELVQVSAPSADRCRGSALIVRDEQFLAACAADEALRWILTPQYLSRRIFLHHDRTLLAASGAPVSWFHTTMFDVAGLPLNDDGEPVFKMSYDHRTEFNICYDVVGDARVRMAEHPYRDVDQRWGPWHRLDGDTTYHVDERKGGPQEEHVGALPLRNRHEVHAPIGGHATLFCLFDPAPTGVEAHQPGAYSSYGPLDAVLGTDRYAAYLAAVTPLDLMVDALSLAKARGELQGMQDSLHWRRYTDGLAAQAAVEAEVLRGASADRQAVLRRWASSIRPAD